MNAAGFEMKPATQIMDELIAELAVNPVGPCERVIDEFSGLIQIQEGWGHTPETAPLHEKAHAAINELRKSWGNTADPHWVDNVIRNRELDCLFALFHRKVIWHRAGVWGYVRLQELEPDLENGKLRLILGVVRDSTDIE